MKILAILPNFNQIYFDWMYLYLPNGKKIKISFSSFVKKQLGRFRIFVRLLRLEPRCLTFLSEDIFVISFLKKLWFISLCEGKIRQCESVRKGFSDVLMFCSMREYGYNIVYYGDYGQNVHEEEIHIYKLDENLHSEICYTFPARSIKHIHNILYDKFHERFFIFTGDFGDHVGIYIADSKFCKVTPYLLGQQSYRAVIGKVLEKGLLYATDAVMEDNYLFYISFLDNKPRKVLSLNGSVIYGLILNKGLLFSTTVEPRPSVTSRVISLIDNRNGNGIKSNNVEVFFVSDELVCRKLKTYRKDLLPMRLFQYGSVSFPCLFDEQIDLQSIPINPVSVKYFDGMIDYLEIYG